MPLGQGFESSLVASIIANSTKIRDRLRAVKKMFLKQGLAGRIRSEAIGIAVIVTVRALANGPQGVGCLFLKNN